MKNNQENTGLVHTTFEQLMGMQRYIPVVSARLANKKVKSILGGKNASSLRGRGMDFEEVRQYVSGDDIRHIDWKVTARTKVTHAKVFTEEKEKPVLIVVDQSATMFFGSVYKTKSVIAAELAALFAFKVQKESDRVGVLCVGNNGSEMYKPQRSKNHVLAALKMINAFNNKLTNGSSSFDHKSIELPLKQLFNVVSHDYTVIVISDFIHYNAEVLQSIFRIKQHNDVLLFKVYDAFEKQVMSENFMTTDGQYQTYVKGRNKKVRNAFEEGFVNQFDAFETEMAHHKVPVYGIHTSKDVHKQLQDLILPF